MVLQALIAAVERDPVCSLWALTVQHLQGADWGSSQVFRLLPLPVSFS